MDGETIRSILAPDVPRDKVNFLIILRGVRQFRVRAFLGDFTLVELPQVSSIVETYRTDGFVRAEFPYKMVLKLSRYDV